MKFVGIDYSMSCPAIAVYDGDPSSFHFETTFFTFLNDTKKFQITKDNVQGMNHKTWQNDIERYCNIANWAIDCIGSVDMVFLEGYAFGAKGQIFNIAENTGILKYKLQQLGNQYMVIPPTEVKKYATGKGNAKKEMMFSSFKAKHQDLWYNMLVNWNKGIKGEEKIESPLSDIIDAYFILEYGIKKHILKSI